MAYTVRDLLYEHPCNPVQTTWCQPDAPTSSKKASTCPCTLDQVRSTVVTDPDRALLPECPDDSLRCAQPAFPPNNRIWRLETAGDCADWFKAEVSNVVLAAWTGFPTVTEASYTELSSHTPTSHTAYELDYQNQRFPLVIGLWRRNIIRQDEWIRGSLGNAQLKLTKELRVYANKYKCPQVFCFDGEWLLLLQFRAGAPEMIKDENCKIDCWLIPRVNDGRSWPLRYAFYRFLAQGFRRCQGVHFRYHPIPHEVGKLLPDPELEYFSGRLVWKVKGVEYDEHPIQFRREIDTTCGAFYWTHEAQSFLPVGSVLWDTMPLWDTEG
ncbi:hypothetical protein QBC47DRAFT_118717 [Echria macrotheca]|uniref:Uncharacterized protein n=1 Tax=Echria macrotheca TaxID=438768 RepID=A0AAJ0F6V6_9PEZI|nr:hypothetical protein QBC47DRAFT_118717 [Echria macrotheca]